MKLRFAVIDVVMLVVILSIVIQYYGHTAAPAAAAIVGAYLHGVWTGSVE